MANVYRSTKSGERFIKVRMEHFVNTDKLEHGVAYRLSFDSDAVFTTRKSVIDAVKFRIEDSGFDNDATWAIDSIDISGDFSVIEPLLAQAKEIVTKLFPELYMTNEGEIDQ